MKKNGVNTLCLLISLICILLNNQAYAQKFNIQQYTANTGLPTNNIFDIAFDDNGIIWFASYDGVIRYDGINYIVYDQSSGLKDPVMYDILIDRQNNLWASSQDGGVAKYEKGNFIYPEELSWIDSTIVHYMLQTDDGNIWMSLDGLGVYILNEDLTIVDHISLEDGLPAGRISHFYQTDSDQILISTHAGLVIYNERTRSIEQTYSVENGLLGTRIYESLKDSKGRIWVAHDAGASVIESNGTIINYDELAGIKVGYGLTLAESGDGKIWIGSNRAGIFWINDKDVVHITVEHGISSNNIYRFVKSPSGNIWAATDGNGANVFRDHSFRIYDDASALDANSVTSLIQLDDGTLWMTTEYGISSFKNGVFKNYRADPKVLSGELPLFSTLLPNGNIIMVTNNYTLFEFDGSKIFLSKYNTLFGDVSFSSIAVYDNTIWFLGDSHLFKVEGNNIEKVLSNKGRSRKTDYQLLLKDSRGLYWIATLEGLALFKDGRLTYFNEEDGLSSGWITNMKEDPDGNIWIINSVGIDVIHGIDDNGNFESVKQFNPAGLYFDKANFLQFDNRGNLWQGTNAGLNYYNITEPFSIDDYQHIHIPLNTYGYGAEFASRASLFSSDSTLYFGTYNRGLVSLKLDEDCTALEYDTPPEVYIRSIEAGGELVYTQDEPTIPKELVLDYSRNSLLVKVNAMSDKYPNRIHLRYKLEGINKDWILAENISEIRYESLPAGEFTIRMQTKAPNSEWSDEKAIISFSVKEPFYSTAWFFAIIFFSFVGLIYIIEKGRITFIERRILKTKVDAQTKDIQKALDEKEVLIKEIHHRVKNNLAVISGLLNLQSRQIDEGPATEALQNSMTRVMAMAKIHEQLYQNEDLANVNFKKFITDLVRSLESTISNTEFPILINEHVEDISVDVNVGVPLGLMINEILSNSFKHAFTQIEPSKLATIDIEFSKIDDKFYHLRIADNGIGSIENLIEIEHQSLGMTLIKSWAQQLDAELSFEGSNGAVIEAKIPV